MDLAQRPLTSATSSTLPLYPEAQKELLSELGSQWEIENAHHLQKNYTFPDFKSALAFVNQVGELAEQCGHHPDIFLAWGQVRLTLWTHAIDGLSEGDFVMAARIENLLL